MHDNQVKGGEKRGSLYIVSTPIGNLEDITLRALRILREADLIAAEDTRHIKKLLTHYDIHARLFSCHKFNEMEISNRIIEYLKEGKNIALVTDSGTPLISDPGSRIASLALSSGIEVIPIPGPSALTCAVVKSGLQIDKFSFYGFLPRKKSKRKKLLEIIKNENKPVILFESPHRIEQLMQETIDVLGNIELVICREMTKIYEERLCMKASEFLEKFAGQKPRGEFVVFLNIGQQ